MQAVRAIYSLGNAHEWLEVAANLERDLGWRPVYWITVDLNDAAVAGRYPDPVRHNFVDLNRCLPAEGVDVPPFAGLGADLLAEFGDVEQTALELMDRMDLGGTFIHRDRQRAYLWLLSYWLGVVASLGPEVLVLNAPPHSPGEFVLHEVCRRRGVAVRVFLPTQIGSLHLVSDGYDRLPAALEPAYRRALEAGAVPSEGLRRELEGVAADDGTRQWYVVETQGREARKRKTRDRIAQALSRGESLDDPLCLSLPDPREGRLDPERVRRNAERIRRVYKRPDRPLAAEVLTRGEYQTYLRWAYSRKIRLESDYAALARPADLARPYVLLALHYQPERTTCPDGGRYNNQLLAAALVAHALPEGWRLLVKEHPGQFVYHNTGEQSRSADSYRDLAALPHTSLVPMDQPTDALVRSARAVATVTGFIGWEALLRGIPALVFGAAWYRACRGVHRVRTQGDARKALDGIAAGDRHDVRDVFAYAAAIETCGRRCYSNTSLAGGVDITRDEQIAALTGLLVGFQAEADTPSTGPRCGHQGGSLPDG